MFLTRRYLTAILVYLLLSPTLWAWQDKAPLIDYDQRFQPVFGQHGMVSSQEAQATAIGVEVLQQGGNAVDAAVAVGFALAVTLPKAGNLGGGGFMLVHLAESGKTVAIDFRETAPAKASRDMYLDADGKVDNAKARFSFQSVAVPATPAGLIHALEKYGTMPLAKLIAPAIALARQGTKIDYSHNYDFTVSREQLSAHPAARAIFCPDGKVPEVGSTLIQQDLAWSLQQIADRGRDGFYKGPLAQRLVAAIQAGGGLVTLEDLAQYQVVEREPVRGTYRGYEIISMPPPSSGGVHVIQMLNILEGYPLREYGANSAQTLHLMTEAMRLAYADRSKYLGDPSFFKVPTDGLLSKDYAKQLRDTIALGKARPSAEVRPGAVPGYESPDTTHFSVADAKGNMVALTYTLNFSFGSGLVAEGTGILLNNEMDDFSAKPGVPNAYGLLGDEANAIAPGKRPLSSMTPTLLFKDGKPFLITGSPGGSRIITAVLQVILNVVDHQMNIATATSAPRMHHQWFPDVVYLEEGVSIDTWRLLESWGHTLKPSYSMGSTQSILFADGLLQGAADPRRPGAAAKGYSALHR